MIPSTSFRSPPPTPYAWNPCCVHALLPPTSMRDIATPGVCAATAQASREPGSSASFSDVEVVADDRGRWMSTTGDAPLTVMLSATCPGLISALTVAVNPTLTRIPSRVIVPNPDSSKVSL